MIMCKYLVLTYWHYSEALSVLVSLRANDLEDTHFFSILKEKNVSKVLLFLVKNGLPSQCKIMG